MKKKRRQPANSVEILAVSVVEAGKALGLGRNASYEAVRRKEIPSHRFGGRLVVPLEALKRKLNGAT